MGKGNPYLPTGSGEGSQPGHLPCHSNFCRGRLFFPAEKFSLVCKQISKLVNLTSTLDHLLITSWIFQQGRSFLYLQNVPDSPVNGEELLAGYSSPIFW